MELSLARDGCEALAILGHDPLPHLVLLDLMMPRLGGHAVLKALRADPRLAAVRVIVLTANDLGNEGLGVPFMVKPFGVEDLLTRMGLIRFGGQFDYATDRILAALSKSAGLR